MNVIDAGLQFKNLNRWNNTPQSIVIHHIEAESATVQDIHSWHLGNGWSGIGYHYYIRKDGSIYKGRPDDARGAHVAEFNYNSLGVSFEGCFDKDNVVMPDAQFAAWCELKNDLFNKYGSMTIYGHREVGNSSCPGKNFPLDKVKSAELHAGPTAPADFDETYYLEHNADVKAAVEKGDFTSGLQHYLLFGYKEGRKYKKDPAMFLTTKYLPKDHAGYDGVNVDPIIHRYFEDVKCYVRGDAKGVWIETAYIDDPDKLNRIANNLNNDGLYFSVQ